MTPIKSKQKIIKEKSTEKHPKETITFGFRITSYTAKLYQSLNLLDRKHIQVELNKKLESLLRIKIKHNKEQKTLIENVK